MAVAKPDYNSVATLTITLASLATSAGFAVGRQSTIVDNTAVWASGGEAVDVLVGGKIRTGTSPTAGRTILVAAFGSWDGGTTYSGGAGGSDAGLTPDDIGLLFPLIPIPTIGTSDKDYRFGPLSLCAAFRSSFLPPRWGIFVAHDTGVNLNATGGNHNIKAVPVRVSTT